MRNLALGGLLLQESVELLRLSVGGVRQLDGATLRHDLLGSVGTDETLEAITLQTDQPGQPTARGPRSGDGELQLVARSRADLEPFLDLGHLLLEDLILLLLE